MRLKCYDICKSQWLTGGVVVLSSNLHGKYKNFNDEELALKAKENKDAAAELIARYVCTAEYMAAKFSAQAHDDLKQEGLMGLLNAVKSYRPDCNVKFSAYARVCIKNKILSSLKKNMPSGGVELTDEQLEEYANSEQEIPENVVIEQEKIKELYNRISSALSEREWQVFQMFLTGMTYNQMALSLNVSVKTVDNAMQRVRHKLKSLLR